MGYRQRRRLDQALRFRGHRRNQINDRVPVGLSHAINLFDLMGQFNCQIAGAMRHHRNPKHPQRLWASGVIGAPMLAEIPALRTSRFAGSSAATGICRRAAISALPIAAAIGERHVLPLHTTEMPGAVPRSWSAPLIPS